MTHFQNWCSAMPAEYAGGQLSNSLWLYYRYKRGTCSKMSVSGSDPFSFLVDARIRSRIVRDGVNEVRDGVNEVNV